MDDLISFFNGFKDIPIPNNPVSASKTITSALNKLKEIPHVPLSPAEAGALRDSLLQAREVTYLWGEKFNMNPLRQLARSIDEQISLIRKTPETPFKTMGLGSRIREVVRYVNNNQEILFSKPYFRKSETGLPFSFQVLKGNETSIVVHTKELVHGKGATMQTIRSSEVGQRGVKKIAKQTVHRKNAAHRIRKSREFLRLFQGAEGVIQLKGFAIYPRKKDPQNDQDPVELKTNLIMEEASGDMLNQNPTSDAERHEWEKNLLKGLTAIHVLGVIHYDIKKENLLMTERGPVIGDFDLAQFDTAKPMVKGTAHYFSPELKLACDKIIKKDPKKYQEALSSISKPTDVYSLGLVFYQWKYNVDFSRRSSESMASELLTWWVNTKQSNDPEEQLIHRMLTDDPAQRITASEASYLSSVLL